MSVWDGISSVSDQLFFTSFKVVINWKRSKISKGGRKFQKGGRLSYQEGSDPSTCCGE